MGATRDTGVAVADAGVPLWMDDASSGAGGAGGNDAPSGGAGGGGADVPPPAGGAGSGGEPSGGAPADRDSGTPPAGPDANVQACALNVTPANGAARPTDILWFIDASPSMRAEIETVAANLNAFADRIAGAGIDYHVVIVGPDQQIYPQRDAQEFFPICVPPPLSARAGCPDTDSERYLHVRRPLHSREALAVGLDALPEYRRFLRPGAATHVVVVTDDDERGSNPNADEFDAAFAPVAPGYKLHSIVDFVGYIDGCGVFGDECSCGERRGQVYIDLSERTGGEVQSICEPDWSPIFAALEATAVRVHDPRAAARCGAGARPPERLADGRRGARDGALPGGRRGRLPARPARLVLRRPGGADAGPAVRRRLRRPRRLGGHHLRVRGAQALSCERRRRPAMSSNRSAEPTPARP
jgi:hypothetical protein